jgi:hypothetical protein
VTIELKELTASELRNLLGNCQRLKNAVMAQAVVQEMHERGMATSREYAVFSWNQDRVDEVMEPFARVAATVPNSQRVKYTKAGGLKIGRPKEHPEHRWVDSYSAIKVPKINAVFSCSIRRPGDEPQFILYVDDGPTPRESILLTGRSPVPAKTYNADQLKKALIEWTEIARVARNMSNEHV